MAISFYNVLQFALIGTSVGFLGGFLGVGGGVIMVPLLNYWAFPAMNIRSEVIVHLSFGTSLAIIIPASISSSLAHFKVGNVTWQVVLRLAIAGIPGSFLGSTLAALLKGPLLIKLFGLLLVVLAIQMLFQKKEVEQSKEALAPPFLPTLSIGFFVGLFSGFFGLGGGVIAVPLMMRFLKIPIHRAVGISIALVCCTSIAGTAGYIFNGWGVSNLPSFTFGYVHLWGWLVAGIPSVFLGQWGARLSHKTKPFRLRRAFAVLLLLVGIRMLL